MDQDSSLPKSPKEDAQKSDKKSKAFDDVSKYFSKTEWSKLSYSEKITYVYMKRNYSTMNSLGLRATVPTFMSDNRQNFQYQSDDSDEDPNRASQSRRATLPTFMRPNKENVQFQSDVSDEDLNHKSQDEQPPAETSAMKKKTYLRMPSKLCKEESSVKEMPGAIGSEDNQQQPAGASAPKPQHEKESGFRKRGVSVWSHRLRERKYLVIYEEISDPEEEEED